MVGGGAGRGGWGAAAGSTGWVPFLDGARAGPSADRAGRGVPRASPADRLVAEHGPGVCACAGGLFRLSGGSSSRLGGSRGGRADGVRRLAAQRRTARREHDRRGRRRWGGAGDGVGTGGRCGGLLPLSGVGRASSAGAAGLDGGAATEPVRGDTGAYAALAAAGGGGAGRAFPVGSAADPDAGAGRSRVEVLRAAGSRRGVVGVAA